MPVEMIGWIAPQVSSEILDTKGPVFDRDVITETARVHEEADFDRVLIGYFSDAPDGFIIAAHAASVTTKLEFLLAHRAGFIAPTVAARKLATLDQLCEGRLAVHLIAGGNDTDQARDGDFTDSETRYRRTAEYTDILRKVWTSDSSVNFSGEFYEVRGQRSAIKCHQNPHIPIYGGGGSAAAIQSLAPRVDVFMLWGEPLAETRAFMQRVTAVGSKHDRRPTFSVSTRPILAKSSNEAWERAHAIVEEITKRRGTKVAKEPSNEASRRLLTFAQQGEVLDSCLWTATALATNAPGNSTSLVGTPDEVAEALLKYYELGATRLLVRGFDPLADAADYGAELIPRVRRLVKKRDR
jgi:alkanesulfonate monooxygenase